MSYKRQELLILREHHGSPPVFDGISVVNRFNFMCCVLFCVAFCLGPVHCVPNVASVFGLAILLLKALPMNIK